MAELGVGAAHAPLGACPVCGDEMLVREYRCRGCGVALRGAFRRCEVCALPQELVHFVNVFLEAEGSFRNVERRVGISYPTVKARLASVNARLAEARLRADAAAGGDADAAGPGAERDAAAARPEPGARARVEQSRAARMELLKDVSAGRIAVDDALRKLFERPREEGEGMIPPETPGSASRGGLV